MSGLLVKAVEEKSIVADLQHEEGQFKDVDPYCMELNRRNGPMCVVCRLVS